MPRVDGIERFARAFSANSLECDSCGKVLVPRGDLWYGTKDLHSLQVAAISDFNWKCSKERDLCPSCIQPS